MGEIPLMTRAGHLRRQRRRARRRQPAAPFAGHLLRADACTPNGIDAVLVPDHPGPRFVDRGPVRHRRTCSRSTWTARAAAASSWPRPSCARWATARTRSCSGSSTPFETLKLERHAQGRGTWPTCVLQGRRHRRRLAVGPGPQVRAGDRRTWSSRSRRPASRRVEVVDVSLGRRAPAQDASRRTRRTPPTTPEGHLPQAAPGRSRRRPPTPGSC